MMFSKFVLLAALVGVEGLIARPQAGRGSALKATAISGGSAVRAGPAGAYDSAVALGAAKAATPAAKVFKLSVLSGAHIALGAFLAVSVGGSIPAVKATNPGLQRIVLGAFGLPMGLLMVLCAGGELVTGNMAVVTAAVAAKKATMGQLARNWAVAYGGNLIGSVLVAWLASVSATGVGAGAVAVATGKVSASFATVFARGILCNMLVCMGVWMATSASDIASKAAAIWFPISGFVALGLDHSVANMFLIPFGMLQGAKITVGDMFVKNIIPATLGNIVGGAVCVGLAYHSAYGQ